MVTSILAMNDPKNPSRPDSSMAPFFTGLAVFIYGITFSLNTGYAINPARGMFEISALIRIIFVFLISTLSGFERNSVGFNVKVQTLSRFRA